MYRILSGVSIVLIRMVMAVAGKDREQSVMLGFRHRFDHVPKKRQTV